MICRIYRLERVRVDCHILFVCCCSLCMCCCSRYTGCHIHHACFFSRYVGCCSRCLGWCSLYVAYRAAMWPVTTAAQDVVASLWAMLASNPSYNRQRRRIRTKNGEKEKTKKEKNTKSPDFNEVQPKKMRSQFARLPSPTRESRKIF